MVSKRNDPNYSQIIGKIPKDLAIRFKMLCARFNITRSEGLEKAMEEWLEMLGIEIED